MSLYRSLGVDAKKEGTELFLSLLDADLVPFCPVGREGRETGLILHADGAGSKPQQSYLHWRETGDPSWFEGLAQDVLAMNVDDVVCVGPFHPLAFADYLTLNPRLLPKRELLFHLVSGFRRALKELEALGLEIPFLGGETADLPDQVRTLDLAGVLAARVRLPEVRKGERVKAGDLIVGLRSGGRTRYEKRENSGMMCNGITLARHVLMRGEYTRRYPELVDRGGYRGRFRFDDYLDELGMTVGEAILSPTRVFAPVVLRILKRVGEGVKLMVHNTGGGLTKSLRVGKNLVYVKDRLPEPDPIFLLVQREGRVEWREMYEVFNMGVGFELVVDPEDVEEVVRVSEGFKLEAGVIGRCERGKGGNRVIIKSGTGKFEYGWRA
ncbi:MAG: AIR synthase-related protein [Candidatus Hadarchaeales archaeon]